MTCNGTASHTCNGIDPLPVRLYLRRHVAVLCANCRIALDRLGQDYTIVERRTAAVPVAVERRRLPRPAWLDRLTGRTDESWRVA